MGKIAHYHITTDNGDLGHQIHDKMPRKGRGAGLFNHAASTNEKKRVRGRKISLEDRKSPPFF